MIELMSNPQHRSDMKNRLARIEGQLRGVQKLMDETADCETILQQLTAARRALDKAFFEMMACAIEHSVIQGSMEEAQPENIRMRMAEVRLLLAKYS